MAKATEAPACAGDTHALPDLSPSLAGPEEGGETKRTPWRKYEFDDETFEELRRRYEETDESGVAIARSLRMSDTHFYRIAKDRGWVRYRPGPIGLTPAARLNARAATLLKARVEDGPPVMTRAELRAAAEAIRRDAEAHVAELETLRRQTTAAGLRPRDIHSITAGIADMTATVSKLAQLCAPEPQRTSADDDLPQDIDEVREALAQRIEALVAEWLAEEAGDGGAGDHGDAGA